MNKKIYLDTSVLSALVDVREPNRMKETQDFWDILKTGKYIVIISDVVIFEINNARQQKIDAMMECLKQIVYNIVYETQENLDLVSKYISYGLLSHKSLTDCRHIAIASLSFCNYITSWNFKHLANNNTVEKLQGLNKILGLNDINIIPPTMIQ